MRNPFLLSFFKAEIKISEDFGEDFLALWNEFLVAEFSAILLSEAELSFDMFSQEYNIEGITISIFSEGMSGTSLIGKKNLLNRIIDRAKKVKPELIANIV